MGVKQGYKQTEVGVIPGDWSVLSLGDLTPFVTSGSRGWASFYAESGALFVRITNLSRSTIYLNLTDSRFIWVPDTSEAVRTQVKYGDILISITADVGIVGFVDDRVPLPAYINQHIALVRFDPEEADGRFLSYFLASERSQRLVRGSTDTGAKAGMGLSGVQAIKAARPPITEQRAIAAALSDVDALLDGLDRLIAKKRDLKQAASQQLLAGRSRLPGYSGVWEEARIADIASPVVEKNEDGAGLPVLTCSKHIGFVESLTYFRNQVFSEDLTGYKIIRRGEIGYPSNHVEEGSIGLQDIYDVALVSPIYVVFRVVQTVSSCFLHRLLKLDSYRQKFKTGTSASIDRRGSLRWPAFSAIGVRLPPTKAEQSAIASVLSGMDAEIATIEARRAKTRDLKQAMMQELLTGRIRLVAKQEQGE